MTTNTLVERLREDAEWNTVSPQGLFTGGDLIESAKLEREAAAEIERLTQERDEARLLAWTAARLVPETTEDPK